MYVAGTIYNEHPIYTILNRIIAQLISSLTASLIFDSGLNVDVTKSQTNLVSYPHINFMLTPYVPFISADETCHERLSIT